MALKRQNALRERNDENQENSALLEEERSEVFSQNDIESDLESIFDG